MNDAYQNSYVAAADASPAERSQFIRRTYLHLAGAVLAFAAIECVLIPLVGNQVLSILGMSKFAWLIVLGLFMGASWVAETWANSSTSREMQYAGLGLYVIAESIIFVPILTVAAQLSDPKLLPSAAMLTVGLFLGLTAVVVTTKKDFSFLGGILKIGGFVALGFIVASILFGFTLGTLFSAVMIAFAGGAILYHTSNVFHRYSTEQYVAASLALFASIALLFWYVLRILMSRR